jgi:predicted polyphosphate/ATP-dependent NAD kinase
VLRIGLIINPVAGIGGSTALKGSDGAAVQREAQARGGEGRAASRTLRALNRLGDVAGRFRLVAWPGAMGADAAQASGLPFDTVGQLTGAATQAEDTRRAAAELAACCDLLLFAGGDGTARDICAEIDGRLPVLGVPAGVKMHSGVFAVSPEAAGDLLRELVRGGLVGLEAAEVRDIDEAAFREGRVRTRHYGEMQVPAQARFMQHVKQAGRESEELVAEDIAAEVVENVDPACLYVLGPGSTLLAVKRALGFEGSLLGVDLYRDGVCLRRDADERGIVEELGSHDGPVRILVTAIGGQGHVFGRGNQQISARVIRAAGVDAVQVLAAKGKLAGLGGRPLLVDTNDPELDRELRGYVRVITGYRDAVLYPMGL